MASRDRPPPVSSTNVNLGNTVEGESPETRVEWGSLSSKWVARGCRTAQGAFGNMDLVSWYLSASFSGSENSPSLNYEARLFLLVLS